MSDTRHVIFLRHGDYAQSAGVPSARQPWALTEAGRSQAEHGAQRVHEMLQRHGLRPAPVIHCSHQLRAWQTAETLRQGLARHGIPLDGPRETGALAERGLGSAANLTTDQVEAALAADPRHPAPPPGWKSDSDYRLPLEGAESLMQAGQRVAAFLDSVATPGQVTLCVGHGASFRHACHHLGILSRSDIARLSMYHAQPSLICHDAHGRWRHLDGSWKQREPKAEPRD